MSKFKVVNLFDRLFITTAIFLIVYAWINFYIKSLWTTFFLSLIFTFGLVFLLSFILNKKHEKISTSKQLLKEIEKNYLAFSLMSKSAQLKLIKSLISNNENCEIKGDVLLIRNENYLTQISLLTHLTKLTQQDLISAVQNVKENVKVLKIFCKEKEANLNPFLLQNLKVEIITQGLLYSEIFSPNKTFPDCSNLILNNRLKFSEILNQLFTPNKSKSYFFCGLILIFSSIILPYHFYYLIFGSTLLMFAIICKLQKYIKD